MNEQDVISQAKRFMDGLDLSDLKTSLDPYLQRANARVRKESLGEGQSGTVTEIKGKLVITVNEDEVAHRQRFTICHEVGHRILALPSDHSAIPAWGVAKRDPNEICCDIFAAELLMPQSLFLPKARSIDPGWDGIQELMGEFGTSFPATASRFARLANFPCMFVTMQSGVVRYAALSAALRSRGGRLSLKSPIPAESVAARLRSEGGSRHLEEQVAQDVWFENWVQGYDMFELATHYQPSDTTVSLMWFEDDDGPAMEVDRFGARVVEDDGLSELTGFLPWPGAKKRK